jgi:MOSC domain-containing protein YiiM
MKPIADLIQTYKQSGCVKWIGVRPKRREPMMVVEQVEVQVLGLLGDHNKTGGKRAVTLVQFEHLDAIASFLGQEEISPDFLRRNIMVSGLNLTGLKAREFKIGTAILKGTGVCAPCSRMEETLGEGGYSAVRGHGGITAQVISPGFVNLNDSLTPL